MTRRTDIIAGVALLILGLALSVAVWLTVPDSRFGVGPRAFPFWLGILLAVLSSLLVATRLLGYDDKAEPGDEEVVTRSEGTDPRFGIRFELRMLFVVCATIILYGMAMYRIGFLYATALVVAVTLVVTLRERRLFLILGMSGGIAVGAWLVFGKLLGAYMPPGSWL